MKTRNPLLIVVVAIMLLASQCETTSSESLPSGSDAYEHSGLVFYSRRITPETLETNTYDGLYFIDLETKEERYLTPDHQVNQYYGFSWSPITKQLVYTGGSDMNSLELYLTDLEGQWVQLTENDVEDSNLWC